MNVDTTTQPPAHAEQPTWADELLQEKTVCWRVMQGEERQRQALCKLNALLEGGQDLQQLLDAAGESLPNNDDCIRAAAMIRAAEELQIRQEAGLLWIWSLVQLQIDEAKPRAAH